MIGDVGRDLLHCDHVHGGEQLRDDHHDPQLPPPHGGHTRDAGLGRRGLPAGAYTTTQCSVHKYSFGYHDINNHIESNRYQLEYNNYQFYTDDRDVSYEYEIPGYFTIYECLL